MFKNFVMVSGATYPFVATVVLSVNPRPEFGVVPLVAGGVALLFLCPLFRA